MKEIKLNLKLEEYESFEEIVSQDKTLLDLANKATKNAYAPYSNFHVGAAVLLENGEIISGNNQENAAYPSGICAERVALFYASSKYPKVKVEALAVACSDQKFDQALTPCGSCRQVIAEYESIQKQPIRLIMPGPKGKIWVMEGISTLLPFMFTSDQLTKD